MVCVCVFAFQFYAFIHRIETLNTWKICSPSGTEFGRITEMPSPNTRCVCGYFKYHYDYRKEYTSMYPSPT